MAGNLQNAKDLAGGIVTESEIQSKVEQYAPAMGAADILTAIKTVDGSGSGLDADLLDGQSSAYYQPASTAITTSNIGSQSVNYASSAGNADTLDGIHASSFLIPSGTVIQSASPNTPFGWLYCNGATISRTTYSSLFNAIGTYFGAGDGSTTFQIPDLRGVFVRGYDDGRGLDSGRGFASYQDDAIRNIYGHFGTRSFHYSNEIFTLAGTSSAFSSGYGSVINDSNQQYSTDRSITWVYFNASGSVPTASDNRPRNVAMKYFIKY